jgi:TonB family protein
MKQKIKVMKEKPELSDDEIRSYMDFDRLVANAKTYTGTSKFPNLLTRVVPAIVISGILVWVIFFTPPEKEPEVTSVPENTVNAPTQIQEDTKDTPSGNEEPDPNAVAPEASPVLTPAPDKKVTKNPLPSEAGQAKEVYVQAEPVDGYSFLYDYFNTNLSYPPEAIKDSIEGVQTVSFQINAEGKPERIQVKQSLGGPFEKEAARLIENMPAWKPATLNGKPVASQVSLPLTFQLRKAKPNE